MTDGEQKQDRPESEKILEQIESVKQAAKEQIKQTKETESAQSTPKKAPEPTVEKEAAPEGQAVSQEEIPGDKKQDKSHIDIREWAKKKGIKDADAALRSLRELEQKLSKTTAELKTREQDVPRGTIPSYQPQPQFQPSFYPPPAPPPFYPVDRERILEQEAKRFNMAPEDFERVMNLSSEIAAMQTRKLEASMNARLSELDRETRRNSELRELMNDPLFTDQNVQFEMHRVFEENPRAFTLEPSPYLYAFNEAQRRIARKFLQEGRSESEGGAFPTSPPKEGSRGSSQMVEKSPEAIIQDSFSKAKTADEQREILTRIGAVKTL